MHRMKSHALIISIFVATLATSAFGLKQAPGGKAFMISNPLQLVFSADNGDYSGTHEQKYVLEVTDVTKNFTADVPLCQSALMGTVYPNGLSDTTVSVDAVLVTTGIGSVTAALCIQQTIQYVTSNGIWDASSTAFAKLDQASPFVAAYFMGTSGWSPFVGGLNPLSPNGDCGEKRINQRISVGSVCVSPISYDFECGIQLERPIDQGLNGECFDLGYYNTFFRSDLFGTCAYNSVAAGGQQLASAMLQSSVSLPFISSNLSAYVTEYWSAMQLGQQAGKAIPFPPTIVTTQCAEAVSHAIWQGAQEDFQCRMLTGMLVMNAKKEENSLHKSVNSKEKVGDADQFVCTSAMEGYGYLSAISRILPTVPAVIIRGASNYDMYPLYKKTTANGTALWQQNNQYLSPADEASFNVAGYHYAIQTSNEVMLNYFATL